jgi:Flp pilus assembly protein CpaB
MTYQLRNIVVAVVLGAVALVLTTLYVTNYRKHVQQGQNQVGVLVAGTDIPSGTTGAAIVSGHMLKQVTVPRTALTPGAISSPDQIVRLVTTDQIMAGEQVSTRRFGNSTELGVRAQLKGTMRAVQIAASANQVLAGTLRAGDHVDLVANIKVDNAGSQAHFDRVVLRNLLVLRAPPPVDLKSSAVVSNQQESVMLAVTDSQAPKLYYVIKNADPASSSDGGWALELRPVGTAVDAPGDVESIKTVLLDGLSAGQKAKVSTGGGQ